MKKSVADFEEFFERHFDTAQRRGGELFVDVYLDADTPDFEIVNLSALARELTELFNDASKDRAS